MQNHSVKGSTYDQNMSCFAILKLKSCTDGRRPIESSILESEISVPALQAIVSTYYKKASQNLLYWIMDRYNHQIFGDEVEQAAGSQTCEGAATHQETGISHDLLTNAPGWHLMN